MTGSGAAEDGKAADGGSGGAGAAATERRGSALGDDSDNIAGGSSTVAPRRGPGHAADGGEAADGGIGGGDPESSPNTPAAVRVAVAPAAGHSSLTRQEGADARLHVSSRPGFCNSISCWDVEGHFDKGCFLGTIVSVQNLKKSKRIRVHYDHGKEQIYYCDTINAGDMKDLRYNEKT